MVEYSTIRVCLQSLGGDLYESIVRGPSGDGRTQFELSFGIDDRRELARTVAHSRARLRRIETTESTYARAFGERIFGLVFKDTALDVLRASSRQVQEGGGGLRFMFELEGAPKLRNVPWELLYDPPRFISTSAETPILRHVELAALRPPLELRPPLRILGLVSNPSTTPPLDVEREQAQLLRACGASIDEGLLKVQWTRDGSLSGLLEHLEDGPWHVFHFIGHGDFDEAKEDGVLIFEGPAGRAERVPSNKLAAILQGYPELRLVVINACEGARVALDSSGVAVSLMKHGLPAVIAMQFEITDEAAIGFAGGFYASLVRNHPVDKALADARRSMLAAGHDLEWATPVLFMGRDDGRLFDLRRERKRPSQSERDRSSQPERERRPQQAQTQSKPGARERPRPREQAQASQHESPPHSAHAASKQAAAVVEPGATKWRPAFQPHIAPWPAVESGVSYASFGMRLMASLCDGALVGVCYVVLVTVLGGNVGSDMAVVLAYCYWVGMEGHEGQTLGKRWMKIRVLDADTGRPIGYMSALKRSFARALVMLTAGWGYLSMLADRQRRGIHDKVTRTIVVADPPSSLAA